jgi:hypothetical protein
MYRTSDTYKNIFKGADEHLKEIRDKVDCLQRSQVYVHNHISKVENDLNQLKNLILQRLMDVESYDGQMVEVNLLNGLTDYRSEFIETWSCLTYDSYRI